MYAPIVVYAGSGCLSIGLNPFRCLLTVSERRSNRRIQVVLNKQIAKTLYLAIDKVEQGFDQECLLDGPENRPTRVKIIAPPLAPEHEYIQLRLTVLDRESQEQVDTLIMPLPKDRFEQLKQFLDQYYDLNLFME